MSIIRTTHDKSNPYVMVNKLPLQDPNLSWAAIGLWTYLFGRPNDWKIQVDHLVKIHPKRGGGKDGIFSLINELIDNGYAKRNVVRDKGKIVRHDYEIFERKQIQNSPTNESEPQRASPEMAEPDVVNPDVAHIYTNNDYTKDIYPKSSSSSNLDCAGAADLKNPELGMFYLNTKSEKMFVSDNDIHLYFIKKPFSNEILQKALLKARQSNDLVGNVFRYLESICERLDAQEQAQQSKEDEQQERKRKKEQQIEKEQQEDMKKPKVNLGEMFKQKGTK